MLEGRIFVIRTDHRPLTHAFNQKPQKASPRQIRQLDFISQFSTNIQYIPGEQNVAADALSRLDTITMPISVSTEEIAEQQKEDEDLQSLLSGDVTTGLNLQAFSLDSNQTIICDTSTNTIRPFVPKTLRRRVFDMVHKLSHPSARSSKQQIRGKFVWTSMHRDIVYWCKTCIPCQKSKIHRHNKLTPLNFPLTDQRFQHVHIDIVGPLPPSQGYQYCLTMIDRFSRWPEAVPIKDQTADTIAKTFYSVWVSRYGSPKIVTTDQGRQFESTLFKALTNLLGTKRIRTTAYHPQANGLVERWHRSFKAAIKCHQTADWVNILPTILLGLRTCHKEDLKASAAEFLFGCTLRLPGEYFFNEDMPPEPDTFLQHFREEIRKIQPVPASHHVKKSVFIHKDLFTSSHVFIRDDSVRTPLQPPYNGPYQVLSRTDRNFSIQVGDKQQTVSLERLKPAFLLKTEDDPAHDPGPQPPLRTYMGPRARKQVQFSL